MISPRAECLTEVSSGGARVSLPVSARIYVKRRASFDIFNSCRPATDAGHRSLYEADATRTIGAPTLSASRVLPGGRVSIDMTSIAFSLLFMIKRSVVNSAHTAALAAVCRIRRPPPRPEASFLHWSAASVIMTDYLTSIAAWPHSGQPLAAPACFSARFLLANGREAA